MKEYLVLQQRVLPYICLDTVIAGVEVFAARVEVLNKKITNKN